MVTNPIILQLILFVSQLLAKGTARLGYTCPAHHRLNMLLLRHFKFEIEQGNAICSAPLFIQLNCGSSCCRFSCQCIPIEQLPTRPLPCLTQICSDSPWIKPGSPLLFLKQPPPRLLRVLKCIGSIVDKGT